jgi:hypothetical protein
MDNVTNIVINILVTIFFGIEMGLIENFLYYKEVKWYYQENKINSIFVN